MTAICGARATFVVASLVLFSLSLHAQTASPSAAEARIRQRFAAAPRGAADFDDSVELLEFIERTSRTLTDRNAQGRFAWYRLRALARVARNINDNRQRRPQAQNDWLAVHERELTYYEAAGQWFVKSETAEAVHATFRHTPAADEIAWFLVQNGVHGECEGDVPCYVEWVNGLEGEYLRMHPHGKYVNAALSAIGRKLNGTMDNLEDFPRVLAEFEPSRCGELHMSLDPLVAAIRASGARGKSRALAATERYARLCR